VRVLQHAAARPLAGFARQRRTRVTCSGQCFQVCFLRARRARRGGNLV